VRKVLHRQLAATHLVSLLMVTACELHQVKGEVGGVEVEAKTEDGHSDGDFCPPGQGKKGSCWLLHPYKNPG
jgi:hypothetical protein